MQKESLYKTFDFILLSLKVSLLIFVIIYSVSVLNKQFNYYMCPY